MVVGEDGGVVGAVCLEELSRALDVREQERRRRRRGRVHGAIISHGRGTRAPRSRAHILAHVPVVVGIALGGALGALARYGLDEWIGRRAGAFPWGILVVNVTGAFLIGFFTEALEPRFETGWVRPLVVTGFLGAYTTFSTLSLDTYRLLDRGELDQALVNVVGTVVLGLLAVWAGLRVGQAL
jgi:CrcB protein